MVKSVVATGKIEPITKVEIKSKANGIIERAARGRGRPGRRPGRCWPSSTRRTAAARGSARRRPTCRPPRRRSRPPRAQARRRTTSRPRGPDVEFARRAYERAQAPHRAEAASRSRRSTTPRARSSWPRTGSAAPRASSSIARARVAEAEAKVAQARAAVARAEEELRNATIRAPIRGTVLTRDVEIGSPVSSILNLGANATLVMTLGDIEQVFVRGKVDEADIGRVQLGQPARITRRDASRTRSSRARSRRSRRSASRRTTSRPSRSRSRSTTRATS